MQNVQQLLDTEYCRIEQGQAVPDFVTLGKKLLVLAFHRGGGVSFHGRLCSHFQAYWQGVHCFKSSNVTHSGKKWWLAKQGKCSHPIPLPKHHFHPVLPPNKKIGTAEQFCSPFLRTTLLAGAGRRHGLLGDIPKIYSRIAVPHLSLDHCFSNCFGWK